MKIILVGMPGSGKSTFGQQLSHALNMVFIDLDHEIEKSEGKPINAIFSEQGEPHFREVESRILQSLLRTEDDFVLATGGGAPCFHQGIDIINQNGISIFLDVPVEELVSRVKHDKNRPLLLADDEEELRVKLNAIRARRLSCYQEARIITETANADEIIKKLDAFKK